MFHHFNIVIKFNLACFYKDYYNYLHANEQDRKTAELQSWIHTFFKHPFICNLFVKNYVYFEDGFCYPITYELNKSALHSMQSGETLHYTFRVAITVEIFIPIRHVEY